MNSPRVSVVIPIYNVEAYLIEAIESVISQSLDFSKNVELLLIDDGSADGSGDICKKYVDSYPRNITYIHQENGGVSKARNTGLELAKGDYVHFFDADDIISKDFYQRSIDFLEHHESEVDFVASKINFFDEIIDSHPLNYKFHTERVIDLKNEPDAPILHVITALFRRDSLKDIKFDENLSIAEDIKFLNDILVKKQKYGVLKASTYYYRKRSDGVSAIGGKERNTSYYLKTPALVYEYIYKLWGDAGNTLPVEYTLSYDLAYRLDQESQGVLTDDEQERYKRMIKNLAINLSTHAIMTSRFLSADKKIYALKLKHTQTFDELLTYKNGAAYIDGFFLYDFKNAVARLDFFTKQDKNTYTAEGCTDAPVELPGVRFFVTNGKVKTPIKFISRAQLEKSFLGEVFKTNNAFKEDIGLSIDENFSVLGEVGDEEFAVRLETGPFTRFGALKLTYRDDQDSLLKRLPFAIERHARSWAKHLSLELRMWVQIILNWRLRSAYVQLQKLRTRNLKQLRFKTKIFEVLKPILIIGESVLMIPRAFILRAAYYVAVRNKKRPLWIISDRGMAAGDNGEALFRYITSLKERPADVYFVISKKSKDYDRIKAIGPTLNQSSLRYKLKFLLADKIISSQADIETTNPFIRQGDHYIDLFTFDFIFLQHGIIRHNLSTWLNRFNKNISLFITSAQKEYDSIFSNPYYYEADKVLLSGLPRYDYLNNTPNKKLILAPTYRKNLAKAKTDKNGARSYDPTFKASEYRTFYNRFMNDGRLRAALREAGMIGEFYLHPVFSAQRQDFDENKEFTILNFPYDYKKAFSEGELLVSDHSSVVFDFAYLKKPVAYAHFDVDTFFDGHSYDKSNFFVDEDDGFGGVYYDYDTLVEGVVESIKDGCAMSEKYRNRVDNFFYKIDQDNCKRVYDAIIRE